MGGFLLCITALAALTGAFTGAGGLLAGGRPRVIRMALGAVLVSLAVSLAGWLSLLTPAVLWAILGVSTAAFLFGSGMKPGREAIAPLAAVALLLPLAAMPQTARDAMNHHMYLPRLWLSEGSIHRPAWCPFFSYPYLVEALYALVGGTFGFRVSGMVSLAGFAGAVAAARHAAAPFGRRAALLAPLVVLSVPEALRNATWAYSDSFLLLFSILAAGELARDDGDSTLAALWGAAAGACKYNGFPVTVVTLLVLAFRHRKRPAALAAPFGLALALSATWALPNAVEHGNPFHPMLGGLFGVEEEVPARTQELLGAFSEYAASVSTPSELIALPVRMSVSGRWDDPRLYDGASGPLLLLGVLLFLLLCRNRAGALPAMAALVLTVLLSIPSARVRYLFGPVGMLVPFAAAGLSRALGTGRLGRAAAGLAMVFCLVWSGSWLVRLYSSERPLEALDPSFLENRLPYMPFYMEADRVLEEADTTLFVNMGNRAFYWPSFAIFNSHRFPLDVLEPVWGGAGAEDLASSLRARGISYVAMDMDIADINITGELDDGEFERWREFVATRLEPVVSKGPYVLFRLPG